MGEFRMPSLGADMEAGTLTEWLVKPGDRVKRGEIVAVVETQKGAIEIEIFEPGTIERFLVDVGAKVPVGMPLALVRGEGEPKAEAAVPSEAKTAAAAPRPAEPTPTPSVPPSPPVAQVPPSSPQPAALLAPTVGRALASPAARRFAGEHGIDLASVPGTGPGGAIGIADIEAALKGAGAATGAPTPKAVGINLDQMRAAIAAGMARSKREIPHYYLQHSVDVTAAEKWLAGFNATRPPATRVLMAAVVLKAVAKAAKRFPEFNGFFRDGKFQASPAVHVGVAIAIRGGGLIAPAIHDADVLSIEDLMSAMRDLVQRTRGGRLRGSEIADPTITVSSLGDRGVEALYGVIYPPQVAIVGVGKVVTRPWVVGKRIAARPVVTVTLSADHRASDGHAGARFLAAIGDQLEEPERL